MKISIERAELLKAVAQAQSVVERRNTIPILANVLIEAEGNTVSFRATDLDIEVVDKAPAQVERPGATTVSAVIFLYGPSTKLASVSIVHMDEAGFTAGAAGMATMIVLTALGVKLLHFALDWLVFNKLQAWRKR